MTTQTMTLSRTKTTTKTRILWISAFALLTALAAQVKVPLWFTPIPFTLQTAVVLLSGIALGKDGFWSQILYVVLGCVGLPFFAGNVSGVQVLFGASGGYLIGFVITSAFIGYKIKPQWNSLPTWKRFSFVLASTMFIFIPGVLQLKWVAGVSIAKAMELGFYPFILAELLKTAVVSFVSPNIFKK